MQTTWPVAPVGRVAGVTAGSTPEGGAAVGPLPPGSAIVIRRTTSFASILGGKNDRKQALPKPLEASASQCQVVAHMKAIGSDTVPAVSDETVAGGGGVELSGTGRVDSSPGCSP